MKWQVARAELLELAGHDQGLLRAVDELELKRKFLEQGNLPDLAAFRQWVVLSQEYYRVLLDLNGKDGSNTEFYSMIEWSWRELLEEAFRLALVIEPTISVPKVEIVIKDRDHFN